MGPCHKKLFAFSIHTFFMFFFLFLGGNYDSIGLIMISSFMVLVWIFWLIAGMFSEKVRNIFELRESVKYQKELLKMGYWTQEEYEKRVRELKEEIWQI